MSEIENITDNDLDTAEYIDLEDENGDTVTFELIGRIEVDGCTYCAVHPKKKRECRQRRLRYPEGSKQER